MSGLYMTSDVVSSGETSGLDDGASTQLTEWALEWAPWWTRVIGSSPTASFRMPF